MVFFILRKLRAWEKSSSQVTIQTFSTNQIAGRFKH